jgi:hypothetical protein
MAERERLTATTSIYFDINAPDDSGDGTQANPYKTLQHFFDNVIINIDTDVYTLTCQLLTPGVYDPVDISKGWAGQGKVKISGDPNAPGDYVIQATAPGVSAVRTRSDIFIPSFEVEGVELRAAGGNGILYSHAGYGYFGDIVFGDCANAMVMTDNHLQFITSSGPVTIDGSASHAQYADSGRIYWHHATTFTADVQFQAFARAGFAGFLLGDHWNHDLNGHTVEGRRFLAEGGAVISANQRGLDLFPGDQPGIVSRGGQYLSHDGANLPDPPPDQLFRGDDLDNTYNYNGGLDFFDGQGGQDTLDLWNYGIGVLIDTTETLGDVHWADGSVFLLYLTSVENVVGTIGNDTFRANDADNTYAYNGGMDVFDGRDGSDTLDLSDAGIPVRVDLDVLQGEVYSFDGLIFLVDTVSVENIVGTPGNDTVRGSALDNTYVYNGGFDVFDGRGGIDTLDLSSAGPVWVDLDYSRGEVYSRDGVTFMVDTNAIENVVGTPGDDVFRGTAQSNMYVYNGGQDVVYGRGGIDILDLSDASTAAWIDLDYARGEVYSRDGTILMVDTDSIESVVGTPGDDVFRGDAKENVYYYNGGADIVLGRGGADAVVFTAVEGSVTVDLAQGVAEITSPPAVTVQVSLTSIENVVASEGNDTIIGDSQNNQFIGMGGADTFVFRPGAGDDLVRDFAGGPGVGDVLDVSAYGFATINDVLASATQAGANTVFDFGGGDTLMLLAVTKSSLVADDFIIV